MDSRALTFAPEMKTRKLILVSFAALALLGWSVNSIHAHAQFDRETAGVRFFDHRGECQVEVINDDPFTLMVFDGDTEAAYQSRIDPLSLCHRVKVSLPSPFIDGRSAEWSKKLLGANYESTSVAYPIRFRVTPTTDPEKRTSRS